MNETQQIQVCANCLHCSKAENENVCLINGNINRGVCRAFVPKDDDVEEEYAKQILSYRRFFLPFVITLICGIAMVGIAFVLHLVAGFEAIPLGKGLLLIGVLFVAVAAIIYKASLARRASIEAAVRSELEQRIDIKSVQRFLEERGITTETDEDPTVLFFTVLGWRYVLTIDAPYISLIHHIACDKEPIDVLAIADEVNTNRFGVKSYYLPADKEKDIPLRIVNRFDSYISTQAEFNKWFPEMLHDMQVVLDRVGYRLNQLADNEGKCRPDVYNPEYRFLPGLFASVAAGNTSPEALTDEEWIRGSIQRKCEDSESRAAWESFRINSVDSYGDYKMIVYKFPEPKFAPEAKYGAVMFNTHTLEIKYYTLEMSVEEKWYYGGVEGDNHYTYIETVDDDIKHFMEWVIAADKEVTSSSVLSTK